MKTVNIDKLVFEQIELSGARGLSAREVAKALGREVLVCLQSTHRLAKGKKLRSEYTPIRGNRDEICVQESRYWTEKNFGTKQSRENSEAAEAGIKDKPKRGRPPSQENAAAIKKAATDPVAVSRHEKKAKRGSVTEPKQESLFERKEKTKALILKPKPAKAAGMKLVFMNGKAVLRKVNP